MGLGLLFLPRSLYRVGGSDYISGENPWRYSRDRYALKFEDKQQPLPLNEARFLLALMGNPLVTRKIASEAIWNDPDTMPECWDGVLDQTVFRLRLKLIPREWTIMVEWGRGWRLRKL